MSFHPGVDQRNFCAVLFSIKKKYGQNPILTTKEKENPTNQELPINKKKHLKMPFFFSMCSPNHIYHSATPFFPQKTMTQDFSYE